MYQYDEFDHRFVNERVEDFRDQVTRRLAGELTEDQFKPLRLMNGLYLQLHAYMLRVAIPYGTLSSAQLRMLASIARRYDKGYGHFTTRQNIQYNWIKLQDAPDILADLASVEMHAIQTSGNCIRNITTDQFAGAAADEVKDPRPYAELIRQWSSLHPEFSFLPRKFKIAVTAAKQDRAAIRLHDIGLKLVESDAGETGFEVFVGGGMGRTPMIGQRIRDFIPERELLSYLEAILRVYNRFGRRDNKYKARIKILVHALGADEFARQVEEEWPHVREAGVDAAWSDFARIAAFFGAPDLADETDATGEFDRHIAGNTDFSRWVERNTHAHRSPGHVSLTISLKPHDGIAGDATAEQMELVADLSDEASLSEIRVTHEQNLVLPHVAKGKLYDIWSRLVGAGLATGNIGLLTDMISCPGMDYCALATARSIPIQQAISQRYDDINRLHDIGDLKIKISGCINACGHHHAGHIGILGVDRRGVENYQLMLGGSGAEDAALAQVTGPGFGADEIVDAVETVIQTYLGSRVDNESFLETYRRVGLAPFKEALYDAA